MENQQFNPLLCDIESGICEKPGAVNERRFETIGVNNKTIRVFYFTDPICSSCWGIEPQLRKLKLEYGNALDIEYRMGGLLPDWSYNSGGISKPSDVAHHWDEVSVYYDMPIDGDLWLEDPLSSSFPPSVAVKAAQMQDGEKAVRYLRELREQVFLQKKNITRWEFLKLAAEKVELDIARLKNDLEGEANKLFADDLELAQKLGVRGFPTLFFVNSYGQQERVYGAKPYSIFEKAILKLAPSVIKTRYEADWHNLFLKYSTLTSREFAELSGIPRNQSDELLQNLHDAGELQKHNTKNGPLWIRNGER